MNKTLFTSCIKLRSLLALMLLAFCFFVPDSLAQLKHVSGTIESVPTMTHPKSKITMKHVSDGSEYFTTTDSIGRFYLTVWAGGWTDYQYQITVETPNHFLYIDTVRINPVTIDNYTIQIIENVPITSTYYQNILQVIKSLTWTSIYGYTYLNHWANRQIQIYPNDYVAGDNFSMPQGWRPSFDSAKAQIHASTNNCLAFNDILQDTGSRISFYWVPYDSSVLMGGVAITYHTGYTGHLITAAEIYFGRIEYEPLAIQHLFEHEMGHALGLNHVYTDPAFMMYPGQPNSIHHDEGLTLNIIYKLTGGTDMFLYKDVIINFIYWPPEKISNIPDMTIQEDSHNNMVAVLNKVFRNPNSNGTLSYSWTPSANLSFILRSDTLMVSPIAGYFGTDQVIITATDTSSQSTSDTVTITTKKVNTAPTASHLLVPANNDTLKSNTTIFRYTSSYSRNNEPISYNFYILGNGKDLVYTTTDTSINVNNIIEIYGEGKTYRWTVNSNNGLFTTASPDTFKFTTPVLTGINDQRDEIPTSYVLKQNFPNPFNPTTIISFSLSKATHVSLSIYNSMGQEVSKLISKDMSAGVYTTEWNATGFASGVYYYRIVAGDFVGTKKLILLK